MRKLFEERTPLVFSDEAFPFFKGQKLCFAGYQIRLPE